MRILKWYPILLAFRDYLKEYTYPDGRHLFEYIERYNDLVIEVGNGISGATPSINILFGEESEFNHPKNINGAITQLWVDIYVASEATDDNSDTNTIYNQLYHAELEILEVLDSFSVQCLKTLGISTNITIQGILSDGAEGASASGMNRMVFDIEWRK